MKLNRNKINFKKFEKNNVAIALNVLYAKKEKYMLLMFQNITQTVKDKLFFNDFRRRKIMALSYSKKISALLSGITLKIKDDILQ